MLLLLACTASLPDSAGGDGADTGERADTGDTGAAPDAFTLGVNLPWIDYGVDFAPTSWGDDTLSTHPDAVLARLQDLRAHGVRTVRWWLFGDGRAAPSFAGDGTPIALARGDALGDNFGLMLDLAEEADVTVMPVVLDFGWCAAAQTVNGVTLGGHGDVLADPAKRSALVNDVVVPLAAAFGDRPALAAWDLFNEPEWAFDGESYGLGDHCDAEDVRAYVDEAAAGIAAVDDAPTEVGSASYAWMVQYWVDADPPVLQFHDYWEDLSTLSPNLGKPVVLGEFPTKGQDLTATLDLAAGAGFAGALPWSAYAEDDATDLDLDELAAWADAHEVDGR
jgi:hypothetical protein